MGTRLVFRGHTDHLTHGTSASEVAGDEYPLYGGVLHIYHLRGLTQDLSKKQVAIGDPQCHMRTHQGRRANVVAYNNGVGMCTGVSTGKHLELL